MDTVAGKEDCNRAIDCHAECKQQKPSTENVKKKSVQIKLCGLFMKQNAYEELLILIWWDTCFLAVLWNKIENF